jgi:outer membrane PBP1 activator LpoA protein
MIVLPLPRLSCTPAGQENTMNTNLRTFTLAAVLAAFAVTGCATTSMRASSQLSDGQYRQAAETYAAAQRENPGDWQSGVRRGYALYKAGDYQAAQDVLRPLQDTSRAAEYARFWAGIAAIAARDESAARTAWSQWTSNRYEIVRVIRPRVQQLQVGELALGPDAARGYAEEAALANAREAQADVRYGWRPLSPGRSASYERDAFSDTMMPLTPKVYLP